MINAGVTGVTLAFAPKARTASRNEAYEPNIWCELAPNGQITVNIAEAEMGQHVGTALARVLADELEADWSQVSIRYVDTDPKWGLMVTGGSWSVWQNFKPMSQAGAAGRMALIEEGAKLLQVTTDQCRARNSRVIAGSRSVAYAEIVTRGDLTRHYSADELNQMPIKPPEQRRLIGQDTNALTFRQRPMAAPFMASMRRSTTWYTPDP